MLKYKRFHLALTFALIAMFAISALGPAQAQGEKVLNVAGPEGDIPSLDPSLATDTSSHKVITNSHPALIRDLEDDPGNFQPTLAESWSVSDDGKTYTFKLRTNIPWVKWDSAQGAVVQVTDTNGNPMMVTAADVEYGVKRTLDPRTAADYAYVYYESLGLIGAAAYGTYTPPEGKSFEDADVLAELAALRDAVGIKALDATTLEVQLDAARAYALGIFNMWLFAALPEGPIEEFGDLWTEPGNAWSYGPYTVSEWDHERSLTMVVNPFWPEGIPNFPPAKIDKVVFTMLGQDAAFANYEAGTLDVAVVPSGELDRVKADPVMSKELFIGPVFCTYYYGFNVTKEPFDDVRMRLAFSYAVDRQGLIDTVLKGGQEPARWFSRPGLVAAPTMEDSPELGIGYDPDAARRELQAYLDAKGIDAAGLPPITLMYNTSAGHERIAEAIQAMWKETLGLDVTITNQEWAVYLATLNEDPPQIWRLGWCKDYADANNFVKDVFYSTSGNNHTMWGNPEFDALVDQAGLELDVDKRLELYRQAEEILVKTDAAIIPIYWYTTVTVSKPYVIRTYELSDGDTRYSKWDIDLSMR